MRKFKLALVALVMTLAAGTASALEVAPLIKVFKPGQDRGALTLRNTSTQAKTYQLSVDEWSVVDGQRSTQPATDLQLVPVLITIPPGRTQVVRFVRTGEKVSSEKVYRLTVQELLHPDLAGKPGLHQLLRIGFTWIWRAPGLEPEVSARWEGNTLVLRNEGSATAHVVDVQAGGVAIKKGLLDYILPGTEVRIDAPAKARGGLVRMTVNGAQVELAAQ